MFFSGMAWYVSMKNFRFNSTALQFLCNKCHILIIFGEKIFFLKNICSFTPVIKISSKSDQKWAKTRHLLLKMFKTPKCLLLPHCAMAENEGSWEHFLFSQGEQESQWDVRSSWREMELVEAPHVSHGVRGSSWLVKIIFYFISFLVVCSKYKITTIKGLILGF